MIDTVIIGGGIAGLAAAYELRRRGVSFVLLERTSRTGGVIVNDEVDGFTVDAGPDALLIQKPDGIQLCQELGLGDRLVSTRLPRVAFIQRGGVLHPLPAASVLGFPTRIGPFARTRLFSWSGKLRMGAELFIRPRPDDHDESIGAFITRRFGQEATTYLAEPLLAGIHAGDVDRLSIRALFPRFLDAEHRYGSLLRAFRHQRRPRELEDAGAFKSLPGGLSELTRALAAALPQDAVKLSRSASDISGNGPFRVQAGGEDIEARSLVIAAPAYVTADLLQSRDANLAGLCREIPYASVATVALAFPRDAVRHPLAGSGYVVPRAEANGILAASWLSSKWPHRAPPDRVLLRTFVGGARDPDAFARSDAELTSRSLTAIRPILGISGEPLFTRVYRFERANAQHEVGHVDRLGAIERALARHPGIFLTGSGFRGVGIPDCVADARATARQVAQWLGR